MHIAIQIHLLYCETFLLGSIATDSPSAANYADDWSLDSARVRGNIFDASANPTTGISSERRSEQLRPFALNCFSQAGAAGYTWSDLTQSISLKSSAQQR